MASLTQRMFRAAKLDVSLYEEVEADPKAMGQAMTVVALASVAAGLGNDFSDGNDRFDLGNHRCFCRLVHLGFHYLYHWHQAPARAADAR